ncbi:MAG: GIY-YIG nuclease family protein [Verrucomicrobiaceae bacterium]|nr:GIY-YIG nuclease family protein [Verrucomicrobiaceae bacterium]
MDLLDELGVEAEPNQTGGRSPREQRVIAGFEEIMRFVEEHGRRPEHGENRDIFERLYAVRLDRIRESPECRQLVIGLDSHGLLGRDSFFPAIIEESHPISDAELLSSLGVPTEPSDITQLKHVRSKEEIRAAEEVAKRNPCLDFEMFRPLFELVQSQLARGERHTRKYKDNAEVKKGDLFVLDGQKVLVAEMGEPFVSDYGRQDRRLRVIYDNGTESDLLVRSLQRALNKDKFSRRITDLDFGPLFSGEEEEEEVAAGYIYVLRSKSNHPFVAQNRSVMHKIGVTTGDVKSRIANAKKDPTYLLSDVEIVATFKLSNVSGKHLEMLLHKFFSSARLDMELKDRFGSQVEPREWFLVPLAVIEEAIQRVIDDTIGGFRYDTDTASIIAAS